MLQPALNTLAPNPTAPATYGALMSSARDALDDAIALSNGRAPEGDRAFQELLGYERFLYGAGGHLRQLATLADLRTDALRPLTSRLERSSPPDADDSAWLRAAAVINAAHDLVATHLVDGTPRTVEAEEIVLGPASAAASREVITMLLDAIEGSRQLMHRVARARDRGVAHVPKKSFAHVHTTNRVVSLCARATMYDLATLPTDAGSRLHDLQPALPSQLNVEPTTISSPLVALRVLRQLCHEQARGFTAASPASLRDVALLGGRVTTAETLPPCRHGRPLIRLERAHAEDQLDAARSAWSAASSELTTAVQGLTRAPGAYGAAVRTLLDEPLDQRIQSTLLAALPSMGRDAARTVQTLARRGALVTRQPLPLQPRTAWRAITDEHAAALTERFGTAALMSSRALSAVRDLQRMETAQGHSAGSEQIRHRHLTRPLEQRGVAR